MGGDVHMQRIQGRDLIKVTRKGVVEVDEFNWDVKRNTKDLGPGRYDPLPNNFGDKVPGGAAVYFSAMLNRQQVIGPKGEKPAMYKEAQLLDDDGYLHVNLQEELILETAVAKEKLLKRAPNIVLYQKVYPNNKP